MNNASATYYENSRREMIHFLPSHYSKVLEIGCGCGRFRENLSPSCEYWGVEPMPQIAEAACAKGLHVLTGTYDHVANQLPDATFDLIICNDVIEHMIDPWTFLKEIKQKLAPKGVIVGSIPNIRHIFAIKHILIDKDCHYRDFGIFDRTHLHFFTMKSFRRMVIDAGYDIQLLRGIYKDKFSGWYKYAFCLTFIPALFLGFDTPYSQLAFRINSNQS
jgi:2-polyprenyl-3-methyl-5-hydroxy-6-metoxy-1,4-benzoquinol methylase